MRIIAGTLRHRKLVAPPGSATRPTTDRVREALFSILGDLRGLTVLDCYAGTGALGLEALSRGADRAIFIEPARDAARAIEDNISTLGLRERATLVRSNVERAHGALTPLGPFDLVLSDPPWAIAGEAARTVLSTTAGLLQPGALLVLGHRAREPVELPESTSLALEQRRRWGDSGLSFFRYAETDPSETQAVPGAPGPTEQHRG